MRSFFQFFGHLCIGLVILFLQVSYRCSASGISSSMPDTTLVFSSHIYDESSVTNESSLSLLENPLVVSNKSKTPKKEGYNKVRLIGGALLIAILLLNGFAAVSRFNKRRKVKEFLKDAMLLEALETTLEANWKSWVEVTYSRAAQKEFYDRHIESKKKNMDRISALVKPGFVPQIEHDAYLKLLAGSHDLYIFEHSGKVFNELRNFVIAQVPDVDPALRNYAVGTYTPLEFDDSKIQQKIKELSSDPTVDAEIIPKLQFFSASAKSFVEVQKKVFTARRAMLKFIADL